MAEDEDGERYCGEEEHQSHVAVDGASVTGGDHGPWMADRPNSCGDIGQRHKDESIQAEGSKGVPRFYTVRLTVPSEDDVDRQQCEQAKGCLLYTSPSPRDS